MSEQTIEDIDIKNSDGDISTGTIKKITALKQSTKVIKGSTTTGIAGYAFVFDACAGSDTIRTPEILVESDSDVKNIKLGTMIKKNSCYTSSVIIKAANPDSITATLLNKGGITDKISSLETKIADLKDRIATAKQKIPKTDDQDPNPENLSNIVTLKKELKNLQDQLRRYLMVLYVPPNSKATELDLPKSITGQPLEGMNVNLISVTEAVGTTGSSNPDFKRYDVVFEACAGKDDVRIPIIEIVSDSTSATVKLIDRIISNSCQVGVAKINALDPESITPKISTDSRASSDIVKLENKIDQLQTDLSDLRKSLNQLTSKKLDSAGEEQAAEIVQNIEELRSDLLVERAKLYGLLLLV